jgi:hypothetical protein
VRVENGGASGAGSIHTPAAGGSAATDDRSRSAHSLPTGTTHRTPESHYDVSVLSRAAIVHTQFEAIHPWNGMNRLRRAIKVSQKNMKHLDGIRSKVRSKSLSAPPPPWQHVSTVAVGGLTAVGFDRNSELLLVVSSGGRGVIDATSGENVARDAAEYFEDEQYLEAEGIGPLANTIVRVAGLAGGALPRGTSDMWSVELVTMEWPVTDVLLFAPGAWLFGSLHGKPDSFTKLAAESEVRAAGFSYSGRSLIIATSSDIAIFGRAANG